MRVGWAVPQARIPACLQAALVGGGQGQREVHEGLEGAGLAVAGQALDGGLELALEERDDDGGVEQLVLAPGQLCRPRVVQVVVGLLLVALAVVRLSQEGQGTRLQKKTTNKQTTVANQTETELTL